MKTFLLFCLVTLMALTFARPEQQEKQTVQKRFIGGLYTKMKEAVTSAGNAIKHAGETLVDKMKELTSKVTNLFKKTDDKVKKIEDKVEQKAKEIARKVEKGAELIGRLVKKDGKIVGHFFKCETKKVVHFLVHEGSVILHVGEKVYFEAKTAFQELTKSIDFDEILRRVLPLLDSSVSTTVCASIATGVVRALSGGSSVLPHQVYSLICKAALHLVHIAGEALLDQWATTIVPNITPLLTA